MKTLLTGFSAMILWAAAVLPVSAGWDNVFQPTLFERWRQPTSTSSYYVAPVVVAQYAPPVVVAQSAPCNTCAQPAPQQQCSTSYVQRSYYQPVTVMETKTVMEQVTTMRTSYYYEPVTSYRYSLYVDPCTGCSQQVATPQVAYALKAQSCPVQSWVSRCVQVPVTVQQQVNYWQPQTTCCQTTQGAPVYSSSPPPQIQSAPLVNPVQPVQPEQPPSIRENRTPGTNSSNPPPQYDRYSPPLENATQNKGTSWQPQLGVPVPVQNTPPAAQPSPPVKFDRITVGPNSHVEGQVVQRQHAEGQRQGALHQCLDRQSRESVTTNNAGRFELDLGAGSWHVYLTGRRRQRGAS